MVNKSKFKPNVKILENISTSSDIYLNVTCDHLDLQENPGERNANSFLVKSQKPT